MNFCIKQIRTERKFWAKIKQKFINFSNDLKSAFFIKNLSKSQRISAFTLAEVIIVIGIIGIVAQITIPTLVNNYQKQQYVIRLKKAYTEIQNFFKLYMAEQGVNMLGETDLYDGVTVFSDPGRQEIWDNAIKKYFRVAKSCKSGDSSCDYKYKQLTRNPGTYISFSNNSGRYTLLTLDGMAFGFGIGQISCQPNYASTGKMKALCGHVIVDVNGPNGPNIEGRDVQVWFYINYDGTLIPMSGVDDQIFSKGEDWPTSTNYWRNNPELCGTNTIPAELPPNTYGQCIPRIMEEGWQMNY